LIVNQCSKWNASLGQIIYGITSNDSLSLNLFYSGLDINGQTDEIAVLDDGNHRVLVFNRSNASTLFAILSDSSNLTNSSTLFAILSNSSNLANSSTIFNSPSAIVYDDNNTLYILDRWNKQIIRMQNPLQYGDNATLTNQSISSLSNVTLLELCVDNTDGSILISDYLNHQIIRYDFNTLNASIYIGNGTAGNASNQLNNPTSIVMNDNRTL
jgi:hypothetical protein